MKPSLLHGNPTCKSNQAKIYLRSLMIHMFEFTEGIWVGAAAHADSPSGVRLFIRALISGTG